jgi:hypothetical protein
VGGAVAESVGWKVLIFFCFPPRFIIALLFYYTMVLIATADSPQVQLKNFDVEVHVWVHGSAAAFGLTLPRSLLSPNYPSLNHRVLTTLRPSV